MPDFFGKNLCGNFKEIDSFIMMRRPKYVEVTSSH